MDDTTIIFGESTKIKLPLTIKKILIKSTSVYPFWVHFISYLFTYGYYKKLTMSSLEKIHQPSHLALGSKRKYLNRILFILKSFITNTNHFATTDIIFITRYRPLKIEQEDEIVETDYLFGNIIEEICKDYPSKKMALITFGPEKKYRDQRVENFNLFDFLNVRGLIIALLNAVSIFLAYSATKKEIDKAHGKVFNRFFSIEYLFFVYLRDFCIKELIEKINPKIIVSNDDILNVRPNIGKKKFSLIVLQSASVKKDIEQLRNSLFSNFSFKKELMADCFLVSGPKIKKLKEKTFKDAKEILVTGQPRYDKHSLAQRIYKRNKILEKLGKNLNKKTVLWTTQTHGLSLEENLRNIEAVYDTIKNLKDVQLIIKLHPAEDQKAPLYRKDKSFEPVIVEGGEDTYALISACDLLITRHSTTAIEAIALDKPVIILNLSGKKDITEYEKEGAALGVYTERDLKQAIEELLKDQFQMAKNRKKYIENYLYRIDGKASQRVVLIILDAIKQLEKKSTDGNEKFKELFDK